MGWMRKSLSRIPRGGGASYVVFVLIVLFITIYAVLSRTTFLGMQPGAFSPDQLCLTDEIHAPTVRDVLYLRLHYFISPSQASFRAYGINSVQDHVLMIPTMGVPLLIQASSLILRLPSYAASQLPLLIQLSAACLQKRTVLPWVGCQTLSRHTEKKK